MSKNMKTIQPVIDNGPLTRGFSESISKPKESIEKIKKKLKEATKKGIAEPSTRPGVDGNSTKTMTTEGRKGIEPATEGIENKRLPKPPMTRDTANLVYFLLPFLKLNPESVTPKELEEALLPQQDFEKKLVTAEYLEKNEAAILSLKKTLILGNLMVRVGLGQKDPDDEFVKIINNSLSKMRPEISFLKPLGKWGTITLSPIDKRGDQFLTFEVEVIKTISGAFGAVQSPTKKGDPWKVLTEKPNGTFYIGCCPRCEKIFEKKQSNVEYCSRSHAVMDSRDRLK